MVAASLCLIAAPARAQWINYPTPDIPRTADRKPNLKAPAPRTPDGKPDLSGVWGISSGKYLMNIAADLKPADVKPWAMESVSRSFANLGRDNPGTNCLPNGPETIMNGALPKKIVQTPKLIVILEETLEYRQIFLDGRPLPKDPNPSFKGYSVGRWEGDTLVIDTTNFNEKTRFRGATENLHVVERLSRVDAKTLLYRFTIEDPATWAKPWTGEYTWPATDAHIYEYACHEANYAIKDILKGARLRDQEQAPRKTGTNQK
jgi:hypothetical protein